MRQSARFTSKYRNYAALYDQVLGTLPARPTVLEIGIANGGSLETWRRLLGPEARIIGVDLNERCLTLAAEGYEVLLLDTGEEASWARLRATLRRGVDLLVDDGGHTNRQQITALCRGVDLVADGGWLVVEDLHASYMGEFSNPSPYSTARFIGELLSDLHRRHPRSQIPPRHPNLVAAIDYSLIGTSWVGLRIDRRRSGDTEELTAGTDMTLMDYDHRWDSESRRLHPIIRRLLRSRFLGGGWHPAARRLFRGDAKRN